MKKLSWKISLFCAVGLLPLTTLVRVNGSNNHKVQPTGASSGVPSFGGNAQHTSIYNTPAQRMNAIQWSTSIAAVPGDFAHYGAPVITQGNTVLVSFRTAADLFQVNAFDGATGTQKYSLSTDYRLPNHDWIPTYNPCITTGAFGTRVYYPGRGGTIYYIDNPDSVSHGTPVQQVFYTTLAGYQGNATAYNAAIYINSPLTPDSQGNIYFSFRVQGTAPAPISSTQSGFARLDPNGVGTYVLTGAAAADTSINRTSHNSAPALSSDEGTVYVVAKNNNSGEGYLLALDSTTLATKHRIFLTDPRNGKGAAISDDSTASPTVAPDGDVYIGILSNPGNGSRGFLMRYSGDLSVQKTPGGFGWDYTCAIVPASMVPSYHGSSTYLIFSKYNNYAGFGDGDGVNRIALLDPNDTQIDAHPSADGLIEMREIFSAIGPTPDKNNLGFEFPYAVREWCINTAAVNPATNSIFTPCEDGYIYRWDLLDNSFSQVVELNEGIGQPYVPTVIGPNGVIFTENGGTLFALGAVPNVQVELVSSMPDLRPGVVGETLTFTAAVVNTSGSGGTPTGTITFVDLTYNNVTPVTTPLGTIALQGGQASVTTSALTAGNGFLGSHFITAMYSGDGTFPHVDATLIQKVHASATTTTLNSSPNPSNPGQAVTFTANVAPTPAGSPVPTGMVTFTEGTTVLAQVPLNASGSAAFTTSTLGGGDHTVTATYYSDTVYATSNGDRIQSVGGPTPTPGVTPTPTGTPGVTPTPTVTATPTPGGSVTPTPTPAQALNLSTRMHVFPGENVGIGGFIITGTVPVRVLIRAIGPSLAQAGVPDALADPRLDLQGPGPSGGFNDNWRETQEAEIIATGIPPTNDLESAMLRTLNPGAYTAIVSGVGETSGVALVEVYDLDHSPDSKLANISTRAFVNTGNNIVIAGFILGNNAGQDRVVLRGIGPSLMGISNPLPDPYLELRNANGAIELSNNDWQDDPAMAAQLTAVDLAPTNPLESGIYAELAPGTYTALLSGSNAVIGTGVVEIYDLGGQ